MVKSSDISRPGRTLEGIEAWVFDLDNTLYTPAAGVLDQVNVLMTDFIMRHLRVAEAEAHRLRRHYWQEHGATMTGLVTHHGVDADHFLTECHRLDLNGLAHDPALSDAIAALPGRRVIHTNGPRHHAERVLDVLGLGHHFEQVIALEDTGYVPKPAQDAHARALELARIDPAKSVMIDDTAANLHHPGRMGMTTVWLRHDPSAEQPDHIDHAADDLYDFLRAVVSGRP